jgi:hypothetical protein
MRNMEFRGVQTVGEQVNSRFTWVPTEPASRILDPFHSSWIYTTTFYFTNHHQENNICRAQGSVCLADKCDCWMPQMSYRHPCHGTF